MTSSLIIVAGLAFGGPGGPDAAWSGFRGPNGSGVGAASCSVPDALDPGSNVKWKREIAAGYSSPVIAGDGVYLTGWEQASAFTLRIDRATGETRWRTDAPTELGRPYGGPNSRESSSPVTDGRHVYVFYRHFGVVCLDAEGTQVWQKPLGPFRVPHGMSSSPVLVDDLVIMLCDQDQDAFLVALDRGTGAEVWKVDRPGVTHGYASPIVHRPAEGPAEVIVSGSFQVTAYGSKDGARKWWVDGMGWQAMTVPVIHDGVVFVHSHMGTMSEYGAPKFSGPFEDGLKQRDADGDGQISRKEWDEPAMRQLWFIYDLDGDDMIGRRDWDYAVRRENETGGLFAIGLGGSGDVTGTHVRWTYEKKRGMPGVPSPLVYDGVLYLLKDGSLLTSMDPTTGEIVKQERVGRSDDYYASPVAADGKIIAASHTGLLTVIRAGRTWEVLSSHELDEDVWATPALAGDQRHRADHRVPPLLRIGDTALFLGKGDTALFLEKGDRSARTRHARKASLAPLGVRIRSPGVGRGPRSESLGEKCHVLPEWRPADSATTSSTEATPGRPSFTVRTIMPSS